VGEKKKRGRIWPKVVIALIVIILLFLCLIGFITDFLWFRELDYVSVFFTKLFTQLKIGIPTFIIVTFLAYVYLKFLKRGYFKKVTSDEVTDHRKLNLISWGLAGIYGAVTTFFAVTQLWFQMLQFTNSTDFGKSDPLYGKCDARADQGLTRQFLHSWRVAFDHPVTGERIECRDELPWDLAAVLDDLAPRSLGRTAAGDEIVPQLGLLEA